MPPLFEGELTAAAISDTPRRMGRKQVNDPEEKTSARFATGTMDRIRAALRDKESMNAFIKGAVEKELRARERAAAKPTS